LVNNAGHSAWGPTADLDVASFDSMFADNVRAPFYLVAAFAPGMAARGPVYTRPEAKDLFDKLGATTRRPHRDLTPSLLNHLSRWLVRVSQLPLFLAVTPGR
jgi:NAD(P)-dependent dehydrogenase (short-subunit alcohol dehydrogenase family)